MFMDTLERNEPPVRDHSSIITFKTCPRLYFYTVVLGFKEKLEPSYFSFGLAYHAFREHLDLEYMQHGDMKKSFEVAITKALESFGSKDPPAGSKFAFLSRARLIDSIKYAAKHWQNEKKQGSIKVLNVEQAFTVLMSDNKTGRGGRIDQLVLWNNRLFVRDFKTSSKSDSWYDRTIDPNDQFSGYAYAAQKLSGRTVDGVLVEVLFNTKTTGPKIKTFIASRSQWQLEQWEREQLQIEAMLQSCREADNWPMFEKSCAFCFYRSVCKKGTERAQAAHLQAEFVQRHWDFMNPTGEDNADEPATDT